MFAEAPFADISFADFFSTSGQIFYLPIHGRTQVSENKVEANTTVVKQYKLRTYIQPMNPS